MDEYLVYLNALEDEMRLFVKNEMKQPDILYQMIQYHMGWVDQDFRVNPGKGGKRLRPLLLLLCCHALGGRWQKAIPAAVAVELLHNFTLIHDDIEDNDATRHGRPTVWALWGIPQAINAGDALYVIAFKALLSLSPEDFQTARIIQAVQIYTDAILRITEGQCMDIGFESCKTVAENAYLNMIAGKTASLLGMSCELGALLADATGSTQMKFKEFGIALGMAFQMQDDILGLWGDAGQTGKPVGSDLVKGKKTLPIIHCAASCPEFQQLIKQSTEDINLELAMHLLEKADSLAYTQVKANSYFGIAQNSLDQAIVDTAQQAVLYPFMHKMVHRQK